MKTNIQRILLLAVFSLFMSCSSDDEIPGPGSVYSDPPDSPGTYVPVEPIPDSTALEMVGFPKVMKKYQDGKLYEWTQYFYRPDGKILKINYNYPQDGPDLTTHIYQYDDDGKLIGFDNYYKFYWDQEHIVKAELNDGWSGRIKIYYEYNTEGQIIQKIEDYIDYSFSQKSIYSYFGDGNLKTIEDYWQEDENDEYKLYLVTTFEGYNESSNMFLEIVIIPGKIVQYHFPASMKFENVTDSNYNSFETYNYQYDSEGRVIEKTFGDNRFVYEYY